MAFGLSFFALNPAGSTHGNPWLVMGKDGKVTWRTDESLYVLAHEAPPGWKLSESNPIKCPACDFKATCQAQIDQDKDRCFACNHVKDHFGNYPHQVPVLRISILNYLKLIEHYYD